MHHTALNFKVAKNQGLVFSFLLLQKYVAKKESNKMHVSMLDHVIFCKPSWENGLVSALTNNTEGGCVSFMIKETCKKKYNLFNPNYISS